MSSSSTPSPFFHSTISLQSTAAEKALEAAEEEAQRNGWNVTIAIADAGGIPLLVKRCDGAFPASYEIAVQKAKTAAHFHKNTGALEAAANVTSAGGNEKTTTSRTALLSAPYVVMRGGLPWFAATEHGTICCGAVGVSGVQPHQDEQVAQAAVSSLQSMARSFGSPPATSRL